MLYAICEPTIAPGECYQQNSLAGKLCLLTCIVGSDREYGRAFLKLSGLLKSNGTGRISAVVILVSCQKSLKHCGDSSAITTWMLNVLVSYIVLNRSWMCPSLTSLYPQPFITTILCFISLRTQSGFANGIRAFLSE